MTKEEFTALKEMLGEGKLDLVFKTLSHLIPTESNNHETFILLQNRYLSLLEEYRKGVLDRESYSIDSQRISNSVYEFLSNRLLIEDDELTKKYSDKESKEVITDVKKQLAIGQLQLAVRTLEYLLSSDIRIRNDIRNSALMLIARLNNLKEKEWTGTATRAELELEKSRLSLGLIQLIEELENPKEIQESDSLEKEKYRIESEIKREKLKTSAATFVDQSINELRNREKKLNRQALIWYSLGLLGLLGGVFVSFYIIVNNTTEPNSTQSIIYYFLKGIVIVGLLVATSRYCFLLGKSYMNETLKNADRIHAISFGKFFLQVFDEEISKEDLKDVFKDWNTSTESPFVKLQSSEFDPQLLQALGQFFQSAKSSK